MVRIGVVVVLVVVVRERVVVVRPADVVLVGPPRVVVVVRETPADVVGLTTPPSGSMMLEASNVELRVPHLMLEKATYAPGVSASTTFGLPESDAHVPRATPGALGSAVGGYGASSHSICAV